MAHRLLKFQRLFNNRKFNLMLLSVPNGFRMACRPERVKSCLARLKRFSLYTMLEMPIFYDILFFVLFPILLHEDYLIRI